MAKAEASEGSSKGKGKAFFSRAEEVAETGNWDFAIEMFLEGIQREPEHVEGGHKRLREVAMSRKAQGGKGPGMMEQLKRRPGKDPLTNLVNAEYLLAKDPGSIAYMEQVFRAARKLDLPEVIHWISSVLLDAQRHAKKPNRKILLDITRAFEHVQDYTKAVQSIDLAVRSFPDDGELMDIQRNLQASYTIQAGKYDQEGDFTKGVKDLDKQQELMQRDSIIKDEDYLREQVRKARQEYLESPDVPGKISALVDALLKFENESYENEAIDVLAKAHKDIGAYQFKMRIGDIRIRQMSRRFRKLKEEGDAEAAREQAQRQLAFELDEYKERAANYPTDLSLKYELGRRQFLAAQYDDAIASLQQAQRDPRRALRARSLIGQAFMKKGWLPEAAETFERALSAELTEERAKELRYFLGDVLQQMNKLDEALQQFSAVAQTDYNYKDVRQRVDTIRKELQESKPGQGESQG